MESNFVIYVDSAKCKGCTKCELACIASHHNMTIKEAVKHRKTLASRVHVVKTDKIRMPVQCRQCENAPCANICPTQALVLNERGRIVMRTQFCAGCGLCIAACPYGAISPEFIKLTEKEKANLDKSENRMIAVRCDMCAEWREREGKQVSACVEACPAGALRMMPIEEYRRLASGGAVEASMLEENPEESTHTE